MNDTFIKSLKPMAIEEFLDYWFYRRVAHRLVPLFQKLKATPNQVTTLSLITGLIASYLVWQQSFVSGACCAIAAICFDCCDGQLARLTGQSSPYGRAMDGVFDLIWVACLWLALFFSGYFQNHGLAVLPLMIAGGASVIIHCWRFDGVKTKYFEITGASFTDNDMDVPEAIQQLRRELKRGNILAVLLLLCLIFQMYFFVRGNQKKKLNTVSAAKKISSTQALEPILNQWSWLGEGHHNSIVIFGLFFAPITPWVLLAGFFFIAVPMNLWWLFCEWSFYQAQKKLS